MGNTSLITLLIIGVNVLFSMQGFKDTAFFNRYKFSVREINRGEYVRMFSSGFLHVDWSHLLFNMITLYFFADVVIFYLGNFQFVMVYLLALVLGNLFSLYFHRNEPYYTAVGASGAVTGILYAAIMLNPQMTVILMIIPMPAYLLGIGYLLYSIYGMRMRSDNIGHSAHFGGAVAGYAYTLVLHPELFARNPLLVSALLAPIALLFIMHKMNKL
ncbi:MAG: rhomboid family intramembrane serine protease [Capnocytophaga sp.]|nr:rhomboid family intramembrane serine protease [Capnocytophaga sp.]